MKERKKEKLIYDPNGTTKRTKKTIVLTPIVTEKGASRSNTTSNVVYTVMLLLALPTLTTRRCPPLIQTLL